jgi:hypothetical protein
MGLPNWSVLFYICLYAVAAIRIKERRESKAQLAQKINATIQETSRHVRWLTEAKLIEKNSALLLPSYCIWIDENFLQ